MQGSGWRVRRAMTLALAVTSYSMLCALKTKSETNDKSIKEMYNY
jgi:hypothetical protein